MGNEGPVNQILPHARDTASAPEPLNSNSIGVALIGAHVRNWTGFFFLLWKSVAACLWLSDLEMDLDWVHAQTPMNPVPDNRRQESLTSFRHIRSLPSFLSGILSASNTARRRLSYFLRTFFKNTHTLLKPASHLSRW